VSRNPPRRQQEPRKQAPRQTAARKTAARRRVPGSTRDEATWALPRLGRPGNPRARSLTLLVGLVAMFVVVVIRLVWVQVISADGYVAYGVEQRIEPIELAGGRGAIYDRNGDDLAISIPQTSVAADPSIVTDPAAAARRLAPILRLQVADVRSKLSADVRFVYLARQVPDEVAERIERLDIPGVLLFEEQARFNPSDDLARALLGSVDLDSTGVSGIEQTYDDQLSGEPGHLVVERDPQGRTIPAGRHQVDPARPGEDLLLTVDRNLQDEVEDILARQVAAVGGRGGTAIVANPENGEILALANVETDLPSGTVGNSGNNLAVTANYEPGSVNKVITLAAALEEGLVTPDQVFAVPAALQVADHTYRDPHPGAHTVTDILAQSSNVGTIMIARQLGAERLDEYLRRFGFGRDTGLGLPHEENGQMLPLADWSGTDIGSIPLGQGISVTAMQMLYAYNVIANDGVYVPPRLVSAVRDSEGELQPVAPGDSRRVVSPTTAAQMRAMLAEVIKTGTGQAAAIEGYEAAGKTGTARKPQEGGGYEDADGNRHYISTFAGFLPADDPKLSIIVVIDEPSVSPYAARVVAPAFAEIGRHAARSSGVAPAPSPERAPLAISAQEGRVRATPATAPTTTTTAPTTTTTAPTTPTAPPTTAPGAALGTGPPGG
jgi:cell division protein FtsI (penicillin-binding protein 3)